MQKSFNLIIQTRKNFIQLIDSLSIDEINTIPEKFNNNIIWNFGHIIVAPQGLCYSLSGVPNTIDVSYISRYKKGTKPETFIEQAEVDYLKSIAVESIEQLKRDYNDNKFINYKEYTTSFDFTLHNIDEAITMVQSHDALHFGNVLAQKKLV